MKKTITLLFITLSILLFSQKSAKLYYEQKQDTLTYYADNIEIYPVSIAFTANPEVENMHILGFRKVNVLPPNSTKNKISSFVVNNRTKRWGVKKMPSYYTLAGDATIKTYDSQYHYDLPFTTGKSFNVYQGYNGSFSHKDENSLDFTMPEGTEITAAREGKIIDVVQNNNRGCPTINCAKLANYISIMHSDGTIAQYLHLKQNGVKVNVGDMVKKGDVIALSGNTGWTSGPHLHFVCFLPDPSNSKQKNTIKTLFKTGDGKKAEYLTEKKTYLREY